jgi:plastocyanin
MMDRGGKSMRNAYTNWAATLLFMQVVTILCSGFFILRHFPVIHVANGAMALTAAIILLVIKKKWTPVIGVIYGLIFTILTVPSLFISMFRHIDPEYNGMIEASNPFIGISFLSALLVFFVFLASLAGLLLNLGRIPAPAAWFPVLRGGMAGAVLMGLIISLYLQNYWVSGINAEALEKLPVIVMKPDSAEPSEMVLRAGETVVLRIINESKNNCHILDFPELDASVHTEHGRPGLIVITPEPGTYEYVCKPHHGYVNEKIKGVLTVLP